MAVISVMKVMTVRGECLGSRAQRAAAITDITFITSVTVLTVKNK